MSLNIENINYDDFKNICRICMFNCDIKFHQNCVISSIFHKLTDLHFETNDDLPKQVCRKCFEKINEIHEFMVQCKRTHFTLMECLNNFKQVQIKQEEYSNDGPENTNITEKCQSSVIHLEKPVTIEEKNNLTNNINIIEINKNIEWHEGIIPETSEIKEEVIENTDLQDTSYNIKEEITIEEYKIEFVKSEHVIDEKSEVSNDSNIKSKKYTKKKSNKKEAKQNKTVEKNDSKRLYKCAQCPTRCRVLSQLKTHMRIHSGERPYKCDQCSKSFVRPSCLTVHMRTHSGERPFTCDQCSKSFNLLSYLKAHMRTHSGERPFKCEQCSKSFNLSGNLKAHMRTHSGECPFKCDQCSKSFNQLSYLKAHMRLHSGERPFKCDQCSKSFNLLGNLKRHLRTHTGERPFECDQCSKSFNHISNMKTHMRKAHQQ